MMANIWDLLGLIVLLTAVIYLLEKYVVKRWKEEDDQGI